MKKGGEKKKKKREEVRIGNLIPEEDEDRKKK